MQRIDASNLENIFSSLHITDFKTWKRQRKKYASEIGPFILDYTELQVSSLFNSWEVEVKECARKNTIEYNLKALLLISLLHYYCRLYDQIKRLLPFIQAYTSNANRSVCRAATTTLRYLGEESADNYPFLRESLEIARDDLAQSNRGGFLYNGLSILREIGRFLPTDVFSVTLNHFPEILKAIRSTDLEMRIIANKVIQIHFSSMTYETGSQFSKALCVDCYSSLSAKTSDVSHGFVLMLSSIYKLYPKDVDVVQLITKLIEIIPIMANDPVSLIDLYNFLILLAKQHKSYFTLRQSFTIFTLLLERFKTVSVLHDYFVILDHFFRILNPSAIPAKEMVDMLTFYVKQGVNKNKAFGVLCTLFELIPNIKVSNKLFTDYGLPCKNALLALRIRIDLLMEVREKMMHCFNSGLQKDASEQAQKISLLIVTIFQNILFEKMDPLFKSLRHFAYSPCEKIRFLIADLLHSFTCSEAKDELVRLALVDSSKKVRLAAMKHCTFQLFLDKSATMIQLLTDTSYAVRRAAIPFIAKAAELNSIYSYPQIILFVSNFLVNNLSSNNPARSAKACSLLPLIAKHFVPLAEQFIPNINYVCVKFLSHDQEIIDITDHLENEDDPIKAIDLRKVVLRDKITDSFNDSNKKYHEKDILLSRVYRVENSKWISKCDTYLFNTFKELAKYAIPYLYQMIPVFIDVFKRPKQKDCVYIAAVEALRQIVLENQAEINLTTIFPDLLPTLMELIGSNDCSEQVAIEILKLTGTMAVSGFSGQIQEEEDAAAQLIAIQNLSYFTSFVLKLMKQYFKESSPSICKVYASILVKDCENTIPFLGTIINAFDQIYDLDSEKEQLFSYMELIVMNARLNIVPFLPTIEKHLISNLKSLNCLRLCVSLSFYLKAEFTEIASHLYPVALHMQADDNLVYFKLMQKFITFAILYQNQSVEIFMESLETLLLGSKPIDDMKATFLLKSVTNLVQTRKLVLYSSRLARICFSLLKVRQVSEVNQLIFNLCLYGDLSIDMVELFLANTDLVSPILVNLREIMGNHQPNMDEAMNAKKIKTVIQTDHLEPIIRSLDASTEDPFNNLKPPVLNNVRNWIDDLCIKVVSNSPSSAIRRCAPILGQSVAFRDELFPIAFISCWMATFRIQDRTQFSKIIIMILENIEKIDPMIIDLAELTDRAGFPLVVPDDILANASRSPGFSLYLYQRHLRDNPGNLQTIKKLLEIKSRIGNQSSARGLLAVVSDTLNIADTGKWSKQLGEWEKALEIYEKEEPRDVRALLQCYGHLQQWDNIRALSSEYERMSQQDKRKNSLWFAWAEYHSHNLEKAAEYIIPDVNDLKSIMFKCFYFISSEKYDEAQNMIDIGFKKLAENHIVFDGSDYNQASKNMVLAQHFIELQEVIYMRKNHITSIPKIWKNRLKNFSYESENWMNLIEIRCLVLNPADHIGSYVKMLSVLRKERKWKLIDVCIERYFSNPAPDVLLAISKISWARGLKKQAVQIIGSINQLFSSKNEEEANEALKKVPIECLPNFGETLKFHESTYESLQSYMQNHNVNNALLARFLRIQANWEYRLYSAKTSKVDTLLKVSDLFQKSIELVDNDHKTWAGWAYANARALPHSGDLKDTCTFNAITGFLKATQLYPSESLEFMCQLFSIFFRYGEEFELAQDIHMEIVALPASIIIQIIPQIVVHIAHPNEQIRQLVQDVITVFGSDHFEAVVYSLNVLSMIGDSEKSPAARKFMDALGERHEAAYTDAKLFIEGMHRAAVSWLENWLTTLDATSKAQAAGNNEAMIRCLSRQFSQEPICEMDRQYSRMFGNILMKIKLMFDRYKKGDRSVGKQMWEGLRALYAEIETQMKKIDTIYLKRISEELANKRGFNLVIPGTYEINREIPKLDYIDPNLHVLNSQARPRSVYMVDSSGKKSKFLLKGNEDLRLDQRIMQFFKLINSLVLANRSTSGTAIVMYAVVPFAPNAGLISWVTGADTLQQLVTDYRVHRHIRKSLELDTSTQICGNMYNSLNSLQRYEVFAEVAQKSPAGELREMLWLRSPSPSLWISRNVNFTKSTAMMSMAGYTIGLGDRHPNNIMVQRHTGRVIHIDFGDSFEVTLNRPMFAERVPFRLSRMIVNALDGGIVEGMFRKTCEDVLYTLRENQSSIIAQLEVFVHEPIFSGKDIKSSDSAARKILGRIAQKLSGNDPAPYDKPEYIFDVVEQTGTLIKIAANPLEYCRHYVGWCPFW